MRALLLLLLFLTTFWTSAQPQRNRAALPTAVEARQFESRLRTNPGDRAARVSLLHYYFVAGSANPGVTIPARRRHILWLIQNAPADPVLTSSAATVDPAGHALADPAGYQQVSAAWRVQTGKPEVAAQVLVNAAYFFKLSDRDFALEALERAAAKEPSNKEFGARLGDQYALAILGVTMMNRNGYPLATDPALTSSAAAKHARNALEAACANPYALAKAGYMLGWQGAVLYHGRKLDFNPSPLGRVALDRAVKLAPAEADVAMYLSEFNKLPARH